MRPRAIIVRRRRERGRLADAGLVLLQRSFVQWKRTRRRPASYDLSRHHSVGSEQEKTETTEKAFAARIPESRATASFAAPALFPQLPPVRSLKTGSQCGIPHVQHLDFG